MMDAPRSIRRWWAEARDGVFQARFEGWCAMCGRDFDIDDWIMYDDGGEIIHENCDE